MKDLKGKRILLTGASRGLGPHIAKALAAEGAELVLAARDLTKLTTVETECRTAGITVRSMACDLAKAAERKRLAEQVGPIDILVNNAGLEIPVPLADQTEQDVIAQIETNLTAPIDLSRRFLGEMLKRKSGVIVNVSSMAGKSPTPFNSIYSATKFGLNGFTASLNLELSGTGVHVGAVCPSFVSDAGMWADSETKAPRLFTEVSPKQVVDAVLKVIRGADEVLVTPTPVRPLLALADLFPLLNGPVMNRMGIIPVLAERARKTLEKRQAEKNQKAGPTRS